MRTAPVGQTPNPSPSPSQVGGADACIRLKIISSDLRLRKGRRTRGAAVQVCERAYGWTTLFNLVRNNVHLENSIVVQITHEWLKCGRGVVASLT